MHFEFFFSRQLLKRKISITKVDSKFKDETKPNFRFHQHFKILTNTFLIYGISFFSLKSSLIYTSSVRMSKLLTANKPKKRKFVKFATKKSLFAVADDMHIKSFFLSKPCFEGCPQRFSYKSKRCF